MNYRPISTLSAFTQIFEKLVYKELKSFIEKYDILCQYQFGFRKGRSTEQAIAEIIDYLKSAIDNNLFTCSVFLDFAKAFDTVNHIYPFTENGNISDQGTAITVVYKLSDKQTAICLYEWY